MADTIEKLFSLAETTQLNNQFQTHRRIFDVQKKDGAFIKSLLALPLENHLLNTIRLDTEAVPVVP